MAARTFKEFANQIHEIDNYAIIIPVQDIPVKLKPMIPPRQIKRGSSLADYPSSAFRVSWYAMGFYLRESGETQPVRYLIQHTVPAEDLCKQMNQAADDEDEEELEASERRRSSSRSGSSEQKRITYRSLRPKSTVTRPCATLRRGTICRTRRRRGCPVLRRGIHGALRAA